MVDNQHRQISGYRDLTATEISLINEIKEKETEVGRLWQEVMSRGGSDVRWLAIAKTHFEEGFSAFVRAIAKPESRF